MALTASAEQGESSNSTSLARLLLELWPMMADRKLLLIVMILLGIVSSFIDGIGISLVVMLAFHWIGGTPLTDDGDGLLGVALDTANRLVGDNVILAGGAIALLIGFRGVLGALADTLSDYVNSIVDHRIRTRLMHRFLTEDYGKVQRRGQAHILNTVQIELDSVSEALGLLSSIAISTTALVVYGALVAMLSWQLALIAVPLGFLLLFSAMLSAGFMRRLSRITTELHERLSGATIAMIQGLRTIRAHAAENSVLQEYVEVSSAASKAEVKLATAEHASYPPRELALLAVLGLLIIISDGFLDNSTATTVTILALLYRLFPYVLDIQGLLLGLQAAAAPLEVVVSALKQGQHDRAEGANSFNGPFREIGIQNLSFTYPGATEPSLRGVDFTIEAGKMIAIIGPSGSGKTTMVSILARLLQPTEGRITIDGADLFNFSRLSWLHRVAFAGQDFELIEGTILENLSLGRLAISEDAAVTALRRAQAYDFVRALPQGVRTKVGDRGIRLSGGQRQRIILARALIGLPDLLILDEAMNALDQEAERTILAGIRRDFPSLTILLITHRLRTTSAADQLLVLDSGSVSAFGETRQVIESLYSAEHDLTTAASSHRPSVKTDPNFGPTSYLDENPKPCPTPRSG